MLLDVFRRLSDSGKQDVCEFSEFRLQKEEKERVAPHSKGRKNASPAADVFPLKLRRHADPVSLTADFQEEERIGQPQTAQSTQSYGGSGATRLFTEEADDFYATKIG